MRAIFKNLIQVGIVVKDLQKSMDFYIKYGIGPFYVIKFSPDNVSQMYVHGRRQDYSMNIGVCTIGNIRFELIEPITESIYSEYLDKYGEGIIHHIKFGIDDYYNTMKYFGSIGIRSIQSGCQRGEKGKNIFNYLDTADLLGFILEIVNITDDFIKPQPDNWYPGKDSFDPIFEGLLHMGIVVDDLRKKVRSYSRLFGVDDWHYEKYDSSNVEDMYVYGNKKDYTVETASCKLNDIKIILIEPEGSSIFSDFLDKNGGNVVHHLGMEVKEYGLCLKILKSNGLDVIQSGNYLGEMKYSYLSTDTDIGYITEIYENKKNINMP